MAGPCAKLASWHKRGDIGAILVYREDKLLRVHDLSTVGATAIGRHPLNDIHLLDPARKVSRFHMAIFQDADGRCFVQDLGSRNGMPNSTPLDTRIMLFLSLGNR